MHSERSLMKSKKKKKKWGICLASRQRSFTLVHVTADKSNRERNRCLKKRRQRRRQEEEEEVFPSYI